MAKKKNAFADGFSETLGSLSHLFHASSTSNWIVKQAVKIGSKSLVEANEARKAPFLQSAFGVGTQMPIPDYDNSQNSVKYLAYTPKNSSDQELLTLAEEMQCRLQGEILCAAFEVTERYLKRVAAQLLFQLRKGDGKHATNIPFEKNNFHRRQSKWQQTTFKRIEGTPTYYAEYVKFTYRDGMVRFLKELRDGLPLATSSKNHARGLAVSEAYYRVIEFCRHRLVHTFGQYTLDQLGGFKPASRAYIKEMTHASVLNGENTILPDRDQVHRGVERLAGLVLGVYRGVSDACDMEASL